MDKAIKDAVMLLLATIVGWSILLCFVGSSNAECITRPAYITNVYDGDTVTASIYLGLDVGLHHQKLRLARINSPELYRPDRVAGTSARDHLISLLPADGNVLVTICKKGKYGRWVADIESNGVNVSDAMVESGNAVYREY